MAGTLHNSERDAAHPTAPFDRRGGPDRRGAIRPGRILAGRALRVAELLASPLLPDDYLDLVHPLRAGARQLRGRIVQVTPETPPGNGRGATATLLIRPGRDWRAHVPGQYVRIGVEVDGVRHWRSYSLTSRLGRPDGCIAVTVREVADGTVSRHLVNRAAPGDVIMLEQAAGDFVLPAERPRQALFVTAGSGITPVIGILRNHLDELADVVLVHSAPAPEQCVHGDELRALAADGRLRLIERHTATEGRLAAAELAALVPDHASREVWACGPNSMLDLIEKEWSDKGLTERLHTERFRPVLAATGEGGTVRFSRTGTSAEAGGSTPLLEAGEEAGVLMPSGCRMGICYSCVLPLQEGSVRDLRSGTLTTATPEKAVAVQTCVSAAAGPCVLDV